MGSEGIESGREFELPGGPDAALLLHGLTGSTFEMAPLARRLHEAGLRCLAPVMAGHAGTPAELARVPWPEWVARAANDLGRLEGARRTFVVGGSMGALVACALAHDFPARVDALVLLSPALELRLPGRLAALLGRLPAMRGVVVPKGPGSDVSDPEMRRRNPCMPGVPLASIAELVRLQGEVERRLPGIAAPALVFAGAKDHTVTVAGARRLALRIGSGPAEVVVLPRSFHLVGIDVERERLATRTVRFLNELPTPVRRERRER
ncbi:MAG TPA: alpha/beta fold hydrolase [Anaeromyxobacteraceae bacterium]|nr:alpha/beta fold hydrolase [Anaeromyxobacteraceae bacterium]